MTTIIHLLDPIPPLGQALVLASAIVVALALLALWEVYSSPRDERMSGGKDGN